MARRALFVICAMTTAVVANQAAKAQPVDISQARERVISFDIQPQELDSALTRMADQAGIRLLGASGGLAGKRSGGLVGRYTVSQALDLLLSGTGVAWRYSEANTVVLDSSPSGGAMQLDPVRVQASVPQQAVLDNLPPPYAGGQVAKGGKIGILGERDFMDTPFNQSNYTSQLMRDQQARSLADVMANDPSVRNTLPSANYAAIPYVRGFALSNQDYSFAGLYSVAPQMLVSPEYLERVEILKGPGVMLNGMPPFGSIGGALNLVPKRAGDEPLNRVTATYASGTQFGGSFDFSRRLGEDKELGIRVNGVYRNGDTPVDRQSQEVGALVLGVDFRRDSFRSSVDFGYQKQRYNAPQQFTYVAAGVPVPTAPSATSNWFQSWTFMDSADVFGVARVEYDLSHDWTAYVSAGMRNTLLDSLRGGLATITNANGNLTETVRYRPSTAWVNTEEAGIRGRAQTGGVDHLLVASATRILVELGQFDSANLATVSSNLYTPTLVAKPAYTTTTPPKVSATQLSSIALADVLSAWNERAQLILGARLQSVQATNFSAITGLATSFYDQSAVSPAVGLIVKPWRNVSLYGNFVQGLQQGPTAPAAAVNAGQVFAPVISTQFEVGAKVDFGTFGSTLSLFQIDQPQGVTDPSTLVFGVNGTQRNQGLEWTIFGEPLEGFRTLGGVTLLDGRQLNTANALTNGMKATGVPDVQLNLGLEWDAPFARGLTFSGRMLYTSMQYLNTTNTQSIPAWTRFDAGVRYTFERADGKPLSLRFNVENLFGQNYWASATANYGLSMGAPRTFLLSLSADF